LGLGTTVDFSEEGHNWKDTKDILASRPTTIHGSLAKEVWHSAYQEAFPVARRLEKCLRSAAFHPYPRGNASRDDLAKSKWRRTKGLACASKPRGHLERRCSAKCHA